MTSRTQYYVATSIDGFLADNDHGLAWLLGSGNRLHPDVAVTEPLRLVDTHRFDSGAIELRYLVHAADTAQPFAVPDWVDRST